MKETFTYLSLFRKPASKKEVNRQKGPRESSIEYLLSYSRSLQSIKTRSTGNILVNKN